MLVEFVLSYSLVVLALEQNLQGFFLVVGCPLGEPLNKHIALLVFLDVELGIVGFIQQINKTLIVKLQVRDGHFDLVVVSSVDLLVERRQHPGHHTPVLVVILGTSYSKSLACTRLPIAQYAPRVPVQGATQYLLRRQGVDQLLRGIHQHFLELEPPLVLLMVYDTCFQRPFDMDIDLPDSKHPYPLCSSTVICW